MVEAPSLQLTPLTGMISLPERVRAVTSLSRDAPALALLTDLRETAPISTLDSTQIDRALTRMIDTGVRFLFVVDPAGRLVGSITSYDIAGERPMQFLLARGAHFGSAARGDVLVRDIMLPVDAWRVLDYSIARRASAGQIAAAFRQIGQLHLVVVEPGGDGRSIVRGLFSATQLERALGAPLDLSEANHTFAAIERALTQQG